MGMFSAGTVVKVLVSNIPSAGYDYRLTVPAEVGNFVAVRVMNRLCVGLVWGIGDSSLPENKIKDVSLVYNAKMPISDMQWLLRMSEWTLIPMGMVLRLIVNIPDAFSPPRMEQLYSCNFDAGIRLTQSRQAVLDAFASNDNDPMTVADIQNIARVSSAVVRTMIKSNSLIPTMQREKSVEDYMYNYQDLGNIILNQQQQTAADVINDAIEKSGFSVFLIDGITGSGKTQVYFDSAWRAYQKGYSVLLMMPEIALTAQFMSRFESRFGAPPVIWHSNLTAARRREIWRGVLCGKINNIFCCGKSI